MDQPDDIRDVLDDALGFEDRGQIEAGVDRDPRWASASSKWKKGRVCEVCGSTDRIEVHHELPFHLYPELEMDEKYWHALCRAPHDCHRLWGHLGDFKLFNPVLSECIRIMKFMVRLAKGLLKVSTNLRNAEALLKADQESSPPSK